MNPQADSASGLGLPQPGSDMGQLPPIHAPRTFHAPETAAPQFDISPSPLPTAPASVPTVVSTAQPVAPPAGAFIAQQNPANVPTPDPIAAMSAQFATSDAVIQDDTDTPFDEEWVAKAKEIVGHTHTDPFLQSRELSKLKAQYIKARYNKDIKVSE